METSINNIQEIINKKAEQRLETDLAAISNFIRNNRITAQTARIDQKDCPDVFVLNSDKVYQPVKPYWLFNGGIYYKQLIDFWLPIYIREESEKFINEVNNLSQNVKDLFDITSSMEKEY